MGQDGTMTALDIAFVRVLGPVQAVTIAGRSVDLTARPNAGSTQVLSNTSR